MREVVESRKSKVESLAAACGRVVYDWVACLWVKTPSHAHSGFSAILRGDNPYFCTQFSRVQYTLFPTFSNANLSLLIGHFYPSSTGPIYTTTTLNK